MAYLSDFLPYVLPYLPGCSTPLAELPIRQITILCIQLGLDDKEVDQLFIEASRL